VFSVKNDISGGWVTEQGDVTAFQI